MINYHAVVRWRTLKNFSHEYFFPLKTSSFSMYGISMGSSEYVYMLAYIQCTLTTAAYLLSICSCAWRGLLGWAGLSRVRKGSSLSLSVFIAFSWDCSCCICTSSSFSCRKEIVLHYSIVSLGEFPISMLYQHTWTQSTYGLNL